MSSTSFSLWVLIQAKPEFDAAEKLLDETTLISGDKFARYAAFIAAKWNLMNRSAHKLGSIETDIAQLCSQLDQAKTEIAALQLDKQELLLKLNPGSSRGDSGLEILAIENSKEVVENNMADPENLDQIAKLKTIILQLTQSLEKEEKRTTLLAAELESLPDFIELYHQERKLLLQKADTHATNALLVRKMADLGAIGSVDSTVTSVNCSCCSKSPEYDL